MYKFAQNQSMLLRILSLLLLIVITGCETQNSSPYPLLNCVPNEATVIVRINNLNTFKSELKNNSYLNDAADSETVKSIRSIFKVLDGIESDTTNLVALVEKDSAHMLFVTYSNPGWRIPKDSTFLQDSVFTGILTRKIEGIPVYTAEKNGISLISTSKEVVNQIITNNKAMKESSSIHSLYKAASPHKSATFFIKTNQPSEILPSFFSETDEQRNIYPGVWAAMDLNSNQQFLSLNGLVQVKDTIPNFLSLFKGTKPLQSVTPTIANPDADAILSFTFDDYEVFAHNQQEYLDSPYSINTPFTTVEEIGLIYRNRSKALVISTYSSEGIQSFLDNITTNREDYQGHEILKLSKTDILNEAFVPLVQNFSSEFYTILDNKYVFSEAESTLQTLISNYNSQANLAQSRMFEGANELMTNEASILFVANAQGLQQIGNSLLSTELIADLTGPSKDGYTYSTQMVADDDYYHMHLSVNKIGGVQKTDTTSPLFTIVLDNDVASDPQFVVNHRTNKKEIVVQDVENNLYLISTDGKVLWKKQLEAPIQGKIHQVDIYKNGRLQLAFNTSNQFIILDRNGREVLPFNMSFPGGNLNPLAVFDYEKNKNYRFVVTQGNKIFMYNSQGKIVTGFTYTEAKYPVIDAPKHIRIGQRDFLVFKLEDGSLKLLSRVGKERISVSDKIEFSNNEVYLYRNKFILTDKAGIMHSIDTDGKLNKSSTRMNEDHGLDATTKTLVTLNENTLTIKGRNRDLELGVYLKPKIFYIYDKIYVSTTDIQSGQVYLFDSANRPISNFPVFGNSSVDLADIDNDSRLELVTKDQSNSLIVYTIR